VHDFSSGTRGTRTLTFLVKRHVCMHPKR
jgi:hypothetical protein